MPSIMFVQILPGSECCVTLVAIVDPRLHLVPVHDFLMAGQVHFIFEPFLTMGTLVWFLSGMNSFVLAQAPIVTLNRAANVTHDSAPHFHIVICPDVSPEGFLIRQPLNLTVLDDAGKRSFLRVQLLMLLTVFTHKIQKPTEFAIKFRHVLVAMLLPHMPIQVSSPYATVGAEETSEGISSFLPSSPVGQLHVIRVAVVRFECFCTSSFPAVEWGGVGLLGVDLIMMHIQFELCATPSGASWNWASDHPQSLTSNLP